MSATFDFDRLLESVLDANGPQSAPSNVVEAAVARSRDVGQRRPRLRAMDRLGWPASHASPFARPSMRLLILAMIATALVGLSVIGSGLIRDAQTPKLIDSEFSPTYEYRLPVDSAMRLSGVSIPELVAWVEGPDARSDTVADGQPRPWQGRGVVIGSGEYAWSHGGDGRFMLRTAPAEFLADLRDAAGVPMGPIEETTLDGRPALTVILHGTGGTDIHVKGHMQGLSGPFVLVNIPSRLTVTEVDDRTIFILAWARTDQELRAWLPMADEFIESIHFVRD